MQGNPNQIYFEIAQQGVVVTGTLVRFGSSVYPLSGITAILHNHLPANRIGGVLALLSGIVIALIALAIPGGAPFAIVGALLAFCGIMVIVSLRDRWMVHIDTASGRGYTFATVDQDVAAHLANAIRVAIDARG